MTARFDSQARSLAIQLRADARQDATVEIDENVIVGLRDGRPVEVEVIRADVVGVAGLEVAAERFDLDREALLSTARAALSAPDRDVRRELGADSAA